MIILPSSCAFNGMEHFYSLFRRKCHRLCLYLLHLLFSCQNLHKLKGEFQSSARSAAGDEVFVHHYPIP